MARRGLVTLLLKMAVLVIPAVAWGEQASWSQFLDSTRVWRSPDARLVAQGWAPPRGLYRTRLVWLLASEAQHRAGGDARLRQIDLDAETAAVKALKAEARAEYFEKMVADLVVLEIHARAAGYDAATRGEGLSTARDEAASWARDKIYEKLGVPEPVIDLLGQIDPEKVPRIGSSSEPRVALSKWAALRAVALGDLIHTRCRCVASTPPAALADLAGRPLSVVGYDAPRETYRTRLARMLATYDSSRVFTRELRRVELENVELPRLAAMKPADAARYIAAFALDLELLERELLQRARESSNPVSSGLGSAVGFAIGKVVEGALPPAVLSTALAMLNERERQMTEIRLSTEFGQLRMQSLAALRRLAAGGHCPCDAPPTTVFKRKEAGPPKPIEIFVSYREDEWTCCKEGGLPPPHPIRLGPVEEWKPTERKLGGPFASEAAAREWLCAREVHAQYKWVRNWALVGGVRVSNLPCEATKR